MRIAVVQTELESSKKDNLDKMIRIIKNNCQDADLVLFPEMSMGGASKSVSLFDMAEDIDNGEFSTALKRAAKECSVFVCACLWEKSGTEKVYNTAVVFSPDGKIVTKYRKLHLFDALSVKESDTMLAGDEMPKIFDIKGVKCTLGICYDLRFPEVFRKPVLDGAQLILLPAAWYCGEKKAEHLRVLATARALENTVYLALANQWSEDFTGGSAIYGPYGECIIDGDDEEFVLKGEIDISAITEVRTKLPCIANIRKTIY